MFDLPGQPSATRVLAASIAKPVHAYLFHGPAGSGKRLAARAFAAELLGQSERDRRLVLAGLHPDVHEVERVGAAISAEQAEDVVRIASRAPLEGARKVLILDEFHLLRPEAAARLLKTIEEPAASTIFLVIANDIPPELVTIASRCVRVEFGGFTRQHLVALLVESGVELERAESAADGAGGSLDRARLLAADTGAVIRRHAFSGVPQRLDGTGAVVADIVAELQGLIEAAAAPLAERHTAEVKEIDERAKAHGERGSGRKSLEERHKRELRRHRIDELKAGLVVMAGSYRDRLVSGAGRRDRDLVAAVHAIHETIEALERNPNETLQLQALLVRLPVF